MEGGIGDAVLSKPLVLGHEICGVIEGGARHGELVAVDPAIPCDVCDVCLSGLGHLCADMRFAGHGTTDGGLRTLMAWPSRHLLTVPALIGSPAACLLEPLAVALHAAELGQVEPGMSAGVFGCGPIGLLLIQVLRQLGVDPIVATDPLPHRHAAALAFGASRCFVARPAARRPLTWPSRRRAKTRLWMTQSTQCAPAVASCWLGFPHPIGRRSEHPSPGARASPSC